VENKDLLNVCDDDKCSLLFRMLIFPGNLPCPLPIPANFSDSNDDDNDANDFLRSWSPALVTAVAAILCVRDGNV